MDARKHAEDSVNVNVMLCPALNFVLVKEVVQRNCQCEYPVNNITMASDNVGKCIRVLDPENKYSLVFDHYKKYYMQLLMIMFINVILNQMITQVSGLN